jgi:hypothetical protein
MRAVAKTEFPAASGLRGVPPPKVISYTNGDGQKNTSRRCTNATLEYRQH